MKEPKESFPPEKPEEMNPEKSVMVRFYVLEDLVNMGVMNKEHLIAFMEKYGIIYTDE